MDKMIKLANNRSNNSYLKNRMLTLDTFYILSSYLHLFIAFFDRLFQIDEDILHIDIIIINVII